MPRIRKGLAIIAMLAMTLAVPRLCFAEGGFYGGTNTSSSGGSAQHYNGWNWNHYALAWYRYDFADNVQGTSLASDITLPKDPVAGKNVGPSGGYAAINKDCSKYSKSIYITGHVIFKDSLSNNYWNRDTFWDFVDQNEKVWVKTVGYRYYGYYLGLLHGSSSNYVTPRTNSVLPSIDGMPSAIKQVSVVSYNDASGAFEGMKSKGLIPEGQPTDFSSYTWFCGGELAGKYERYYDGHAKIRLIATDSNGGHDVSNTTENEGTPELVLTGSNATITVKYRGYGYVSASSKGISSGYQNYDKTNFTLNVGEQNKTQTTRVVDNGTTSDSYNSWPVPDTEDGTVTLSLGDSATICTSNQYYTHYKDSWQSDMATVTTCYKVSYKEDSKVSIGSISAEKIVDRNNKTFFSFSAEHDTLLKLGSFAYGSSVLGDLSLASRNYGPLVSGTVAPGRVRVYSTNKITKEGVSGNDATIKLQGIKFSNPIVGEASSSDSSLEKGSYYKDFYNGPDNGSSTLIFPEQMRGFVTTTSHPAELGTSTITNATTESSSATISLTADSLKCEQFDDVEIGVKNAVNYGRISFMGGGVDNAWSAGNSSFNRGEWRRDAATVWLRPGNNVSLYYSVCMGNQALQDAQAYPSEPAVINTYTVSNNGHDDAMKEFYYTNNAVYLDSIDGKNISAKEIGSASTTAGSSSEDRINASYQLQASTNEISAAELLGKSIDNTLTWDSSTKGGTATATITVNVPYNYYLEPTASPTGDEPIVYIGENASFEWSIQNKGRINTKTDQTEFFTGKYATNTKPTSYSLHKLILPSNVSSSVITSSNDVYTLGNNVDDVQQALYGSNLSNYANNAELIKASEPDGIIIEGNSFGDGKSLRDDVSLDKVEGEVGSKICLVISVFPADSHNAKNAGTIDDDNQAAAFEANPGNAGYTRTRVSCATAGKKPTVSIEGGSVVSGGEITTKTTKYDNNIFGSWSEYGLVAAGGNGMGSGASLAYGNSRVFRVDNWNAIRGNNSEGANADGLENNNLANSQSIGNFNPDSSDKNKYGIDAGDSEKYLASSNAFAKNFREKYIDVIDGVDANKVKKFASVGDFKNGGGATEENKLYLIYSGGDIDISEDIFNNTKKSIVVVYARNINISPAVSRIDAMLIATGNLDTCYGYGPVDGEGSYELNPNGYSGNAHLLQNCSTQLAINGAVSAAGINLDRAYGGGSVPNEGNVLNSDTLTLRAEIFNYDPRVIFWAYDDSIDNQTISPTYVKELSPRL